jgi:hypothetical protein
MVYFEGGDLHTLMQSEKEELIVAATAVRDLPTVEIVSRELAMALPEPGHDDDGTG